MNIVILKHQPNGQQYLFQVPEGKKLKAGDKVLVQNKRGLTDAQCLCDSFTCDETAAEALAQVFGGKLPLSMVVGKYTLERWDDGEVSL